MSHYLIHYIASLWITSGTTLGIALLVALKGWGIPANRWFVIFNLSIASWSFFQGLLPLSTSTTMAIWIQSIEHVPVVFISTLFLHFVHALLDIQRRFWLKFHYTLSCLFLLAIPLGLLVHGIDTKHPKLPYVVEPGVLYPAMVVWFLLQSGQGLWYLFRAYLTSSGATRNRMKYLAWGALIGYVGGCGNYLYVFDWDLPFYNPGGTYGVPIYVAMTTYAILRHRLMDINVVIKRTMIYTVIYSISLAVFGSVVIFLGQWAALGTIDPGLVWLSMVGLLIVVAMVRPLDRILTRLTDRFLFGDRYIYQQTLKAAAAGMSQIRNLPQLLELIVKVVVKHVKVAHATIFLKKRNDPGFTVAASHGKVELLPNKPAFEDTDPLVVWLTRCKEPIVLEEMKEQLKRTQHSQKDPQTIELLSKLVEEMEALQTALCVPSFLENRLKGFLLLGEKLSGAMYNQEDLDLFFTLAGQAALAIENAEAYEELRDTRDQMLQSERMATLGKFAIDMAHEIKNPLQAILGFFDLIPSKLDDPEFRTHFAALAKEEAERIDQLVKQLMVYAKPKVPHCQPIEITAAIDSVLALLENDLDRHRITVRKGYSPNGLVVEADRDQMKQVFWNLIRNAVEAMAQSGNPKEVGQVQSDPPPRYLDIVAFPDEELLVVKIRDTGVGIPEDKLPLLCTPFYTTKERGSGLGLAIVQNILKIHHGSLAIESQLGVGTTVTVLLPRRQPIAFSP